MLNDNAGVELANKLIGHVIVIYGTVMSILITFYANPNCQPTFLRMICGNQRYGYYTLLFYPFEFIILVSAWEIGFSSDSILSKREQKNKKELYIRLELQKQAEGKPDNKTDNLGVAGESAYFTDFDLPESKLILKQKYIDLNNFHPVIVAVILILSCYLLPWIPILLFTNLANYLVPMYFIVTSQIIVEIVLWYIVAER